MDSASFTRTAEALRLPRSTVSAALKQLEARLGTQLLYRTTRKVTPTQDGLIFYEHCLRLVADAEEVEGLFRSGGPEPTGTLRVNVPGRIGRLIIMPALPEFLELYPAMHVDLGVTDRAVNLIEESIDCVLRIGQPADPALVVKPMGELPLVNVASPAYIARYGAPMTPADLGGHLAVHYASSGGPIASWEWCEDGMEKTVMMKGRVTVNNAETYLAACLAGLGLIQVPAYDVRAHLEAGELVEVLKDYRAAPMPMSLLYTRRQHLSRRVQVFADWLGALLQAKM